MPYMFKEKFANYQVITDGTEIAAEAPEAMHTRSVLYSDHLLELLQQEEYNLYLKHSLFVFLTVKLSVDMTY